jgi:2-polyprenyl-3-methyl-5-hydroxy-6-metoxy-1,4-benzoquinol methylase
MKQKMDNKVKESKNIICPLCGSQRSLPCHEERVLDVDYSQDKFSVHTEQYFICDNCGLIYIYPRPSADVLSKYYASIPVSQISNKVLNDYKKSEYERTVNFILTNTGLDSGRIIDVGAASGDLLYYFGSHTNAHLIGIEPSEECCNFAKETYNIEMIQNQFEDIDLTEYGLMDSADLVLCCNTLEHTINPACFLRDLSLMVKPSGFLYVEVPSTRILATFRDARYGRNIHHLHLNHFLVSNLSSICEKLGLFPVTVFDDIGTNYPSLKALFIKQAPAERAKSLFLQQVRLLDDTYKQAKSLIAAALNTSDKKIVLWGAGMDLFYVLRENTKIFPPDRFILVDRNPRKQNKDFFSLKVINPEEVDWIHVGHVLITPSSQMLQLHIKEDIDRICPDHIDYFCLFPVKNQKLYPEGII